MNTKELLSKLTEPAGVSGCECYAAKIAAELLQPYGEAKYDPDSGCVYFKRRHWNDEKPTILLDAHIDEVGMIVTYITDDGFLKVAPCGSPDARCLLAQQVTVYGKEKLFGFVTSIPPHLENDNTKAAAFDEIYIDLGMSGERAKTLVSLGDRVLIENKLETLSGSKVTSKALDDRSGVASIILALEILKDKSTDANIAVLLSSQEEIGERGANMGAYNINPDIAIAIDVSFAKTHYESAESLGIMGMGPMIGLAPSLSRKMSEDLIMLAESNGIPYQLEVMEGKTGTNADVIGVTRGGIPSVTVSIPEKHMHTPVEIVDINDVESTAKLLAKYCESVYVDL